MCISAETLTRIECVRKISTHSIKRSIITMVFWCKWNSNICIFIILRILKMFFKATAKLGFQFLIVCGTQHFDGVIAPSSQRRFDNGSENIVWTYCYFDHWNWQISFPMFDSWLNGWPWFFRTKFFCKIFDRICYISAVPFRARFNVTTVPPGFYKLISNL